MTSIIEKRRSLHRNLEKQQSKNHALEFEIGRLQALANIGTVTCMIAHEINNLLTPLGNYAELSLNNPDDAELKDKALKKTVLGCGRASKILQSMLNVANGQTTEKRSVKLLTIVEEIFDCLCRDFAKDQIQVALEIPKDLKVWAIPVHIQQVLMNLILNAREAMLPHGGFLTIQAEQDGDFTWLIVTDTGCGIESKNLKKIFEPFFTTKKDNSLQPQSVSGGLGLAFCKKIIAEHDGSICVESTVGEGTTFELNIPAPPVVNS